ncbi:2,3-bisphosphoglycerate-dependent phosphoglycerate mutase, partial [Candidatus Parcubacteria bacterium]|nr:2,3-bisphosphoglycerate-dependent phosphoglycerate mutase [Candidatus Parcubacteria bacterium]
MYKLVLLRHGQSAFNAKDIFTGWRDPSLSEKGKQESKKAGKLLKQANFCLDLAFTSELKRATQTLDIALKELGLTPLVKKSIALNERHYGALQGKNKNDILKEYGSKKFFQFRRSWAIKPPALKKPEKKGEPLTESLKDTWQRI